LPALYTSQKSAASAQIPRATPTPIPALALVPRPVVWSGDVVEVDMGRLCVEAGVAGLCHD
jgi:hypothetical protein